jgi:hypothetical protein
VFVVSFCVFGVFFVPEEAATMTERITTATEEQWAEVDRIRDRWLARQTESASQEEVENAVRMAYHLIGEPKNAETVEVIRVAGPYALAMTQLVLKGIVEQDKLEIAKERPMELFDRLDDPEFSNEFHAALRNQWVHLWWQPLAGRYEGAKALGVQFDEEKLQTLVEWAKCVPLCYATLDACIVSRRPHTVKWVNDQLHCDDGPSVEFDDGFKLWSLNGVPVDEQIVMRPETQTLEQLQDEPSPDLQAIRIERYGWPRYLREIGAKLVDFRHNEVEDTMESLFELDNGSLRLVASCPTGRIFTWFIPEGVTTCAEAKKCLGEHFPVLGRT